MAAGRAHPAAEVRPGGRVDVRARRGALNGLNGDYHRDRGVYLAREAAAYAGPGEADHAAGIALENGDPRLATATIYSTLEPCSQRKSSPVTCTQLILDAGIPRVVVAWREPATFVADCQGRELLEQAGRVVVEVPGFAMEPNRHLQR